jgi:peroxiredoxin
MRCLLNFASALRVLGLGVCGALALTGCSTSTQETASSSRPAPSAAEENSAADAADAADDEAKTEASAAVASTAAASTEAASTAAPSNESQPAQQAGGETAPIDDAATADVAPTGRETREAAKPVIAEYAKGVPPVLLSDGHAKLSTIQVGGSLPAIELPKLGGGNANLESLAGSKATVVLFWTNDVWMSRMALGDLQRDVAANYPPADVAVVGVAVGASDDVMAKALELSGAKFPQLVDAQGQAASQLGENALPRVYVLDRERRVAWFDIEYSESSRREIGQTLAALAGEQ